MQCPYRGGDLYEDIILYQNGERYDVIRIENLDNFQNFRIAGKNVHVSWMFVSLRKQEYYILERGLCLLLEVGQVQSLDVVAIKVTTLFHVYILRNTLLGDGGERVL